jgi:hypothetical protein
MSSRNPSWHVSASKDFSVGLEMGLRSTCPQPDSMTSPESNFSLCDKCSQEPWSYSTWDKLAAGQDHFEYNVLLHDIEAGAQVRCWWCCVVLDTVPEPEAEQHPKPVMLDIDLRFQVVLNVEPKKFHIVNLKVERRDDPTEQYEVRQLGISASQREFN